MSGTVNTAVEMANLALAHLKEAPIRDFDFSSVASRWFRNHYAAHRDAYLAMHDWDFAIELVNLPAETENRRFAGPTSTSCQPARFAFRSRVLAGRRGDDHSLRSGGAAHHVGSSTAVSASPCAPGGAGGRIRPAVRERVRPVSGGGLRPFDHRKEQPCGSLAPGGAGSLRPGRNIRRPAGHAAAHD